MLGRRPGYWIENMKSRRTGIPPEKSELMDKNREQRVFSHDLACVVLLFFL